jgi:hypothetical protein
MGFLRRALGGSKKDEPAAAGPASGARVSGNRYWRCPGCGGVQSKKELDTVFHVGAPITTAGAVTCAKCGREHGFEAVYGGSYDFTGEVEVLSRVQLAQKYIDAEITGDADGVEALLAPDAVMASMRGDTAGARAIGDRLRNPSGPGAGMMGRMQWGPPLQEGDKVSIQGKASTPNPMFSGMTLTLTFNGSNKISRIEMSRAG